jgi:hypothetical protein
MQYCSVQMKVTVVEQPCSPACLHGWWLQCKRHMPNALPTSPAAIPLPQPGRDNSPTQRQHLHLPNMAAAMVHVTLWTLLSSVYVCCSRL